MRGGRPASRQDGDPRPPHAQGGREGGSLRERISGTTDLVGGADVVFVLDHKPREGRVIVECVKARAMPEPLPFSVEYWSPEAGKAPRFAFAGECEPTKARQRRTPPGKHARAVILSALQEAGGALPTEALLRRAMDSGLKQRTAERALRRLKRSGDLTQPHRGWWCLAEPA